MKDDSCTYSVISTGLTVRENNDANETFRHFRFLEKLSFLDVLPSSAQQELAHLDLCQYSALVGASSFCSSDILSSLEICTAVFCRKMVDSWRSFEVFMMFRTEKYIDLQLLAAAHALLLSIPCLCMTVQVISLWYP
jgi:hypothetical protein